MLMEKTKTDSTKNTHNLYFNLGSSCLLNFVVKIAVIEDIADILEYAKICWW